VQLQLGDCSSTYSSGVSSCTYSSDVSSEPSSWIQQQSIQEQVCAPMLVEDDPLHDSAITMCCPDGHTMHARVQPELWIGGYRASCFTCGDRVSARDASYCCKVCNFCLCMDCATAQLAGSLESHGVCLTADCLSAGDIFLCGPDVWGIHHVILCRGLMKALADPEVARTIKRDMPEVMEMDLFVCPTIESSRPLRGEECAWYPAQSFFARSHLTGEVLLLADIADGTNTISVSSRGVPVKMLLHPLRPANGSCPPLDPVAFGTAIGLCAEVSRRWGKSTAIRALTSRHGACLKPEDYAGPASRAELMEDLRARRSRKPICSSVAIQVWQQYFELVCGSGPQGVDLAARQILRWMPLYSDATTPSALLKALSKRGWILIDSLGV